MNEITKPKYGNPCNHCGLCCRLSLCKIGEMAFPDHVLGSCPALVVAKDGQFCGLVAIERETKAEPMLQKILGIGCGCSMEDEDTTKEQALKFDRESRELVSRLYPNG